MSSQRIFFSYLYAARQPCLILRGTSLLAHTYRKRLANRALRMELIRALNAADTELVAAGNDPLSAHDVQCFVDPRRRLEALTIAEHYHAHCGLSDATAIALDDVIRRVK
jgi:hypothetical protein